MAVLNSRSVRAAVRNLKVFSNGGAGFVPNVTERDVEKAIPNSGAVGLGRGIARFALMSDGRFFAQLGSFWRHEAH